MFGNMHGVASTCDLERGEGGKTEFCPFLSFDFFVDVHLSLLVIFMTFATLTCCLLTPTVFFFVGLQVLYFSESVKHFSRRERGRCMSLVYCIIPIPLLAMVLSAPRSEWVRIGRVLHEEQTSMPSTVLLLVSLPPLLLCLLTLLVPEKTRNRRDRQEVILFLVLLGGLAFMWWLALDLVSSLQATEMCRL